MSELTHTAQAGYSQLLAMGQTVNIGFDSTRILAPVAAFDFFNPSISSGLGFSITQPLFNNRNNMQARTALKIVRTQLLIATDQTETQIGNLNLSRPPGSIGL